MYRQLLASLYGNYQPEKTLKENENGKILLLRDPESGDRMIYREFIGSGDAYRKLRELHSPHLPRVYAVREESGMVSILEEYISGDSLAMLLSGGSLTEEQARKIGIQLCSALMALHRAGIVHRDLKPENVLLRQDQAVLIDFDASRLTNPHHTTDTRIMGTTGYAAPEQYGFSQTDARADFYAFGILLNEMLTCQHPSKRLAEGSLRPVVEKCIEVNMDKRYPNAAALMAALEPQKQRRHRALAAVLVLSAFVLGFLAANFPLPEKEAAVEVLSHDPLVVEDAKKVGITTPYTSTFLYDLDGDGEKEEYQFGVLIDGLPDLPFIVTSDTISPYDETDLITSRTVYPCVWRTKEDGSVEKVMEFSDLLENGQTCLWRLTNLDCEAPPVIQADGDWKGGLAVEYTYADHLGIWLYETRATLEGVELTGQAVTQILSENPEG